MVFWDRQTLKLRAKNVLSKYYWKSFFVLLLLAFLIGGVKITKSYYVAPNTNLMLYETQQFKSDLIMQAINARYYFKELLGPLFIIVLFAFFIYRICGANIFIIGKCRYMTSLTYNDSAPANILYGFKNNSFSKNVTVMLKRDIFIFLWSLLFFIPGVVKAYSYSMLPYILAENPGISGSRALDISKRMTQGEKLNIFILDLSFIGWYMLGALAMGIGIFFVAPYYEATKAELYGAMRFKAVKTGIVSSEEIGKELF